MESTERRPIAAAVREFGNKLKTSIWVTTIVVWGWIWSFCCREVVDCYCYSVLGLFKSVSERC